MCSPFSILALLLATLLFSLSFGPESTLATTPALLQHLGFKVETSKSRPKATSDENPFTDCLQNSMAYADVLYWRNRILEKKKAPGKLRLIKTSAHVYQIVKALFVDKQRVQSGVEAFKEVPTELTDIGHYRKELFEALPGLAKAALKPAQLGGKLKKAIFLNEKDEEEEDPLAALFPTVNRVDDEDAQETGAISAFHYSLGQLLTLLLLFIGAVGLFVYVAFFK